MRYPTGFCMNKIKRDERLNIIKLYTANTIRYFYICKSN